jgi:hypothetical protein
MRDLAYGVPGAYNSLRRRPILILHTTAACHMGPEHRVAACLAARRLYDTHSFECFGYAGLSSIEYAAYDATQT